jgi:hypothetical protein
MFTDVVVDDHPGVLEKAVENGAIATGLLFPWNQAYSNDRFKLFSNLDDILDCILRQRQQDNKERASSGLPQIYSWGRLSQ